MHSGVPVLGRADSLAWLTGTLMEGSHCSNALRFHMRKKKLYGSKGQETKVSDPV